MVLVTKARTDAENVFLQSPTSSLDTVSGPLPSYLRSRVGGIKLIDIGGKMGKCACHSNPREPIRDAMRAPQDVAEAHEDDRERAKEMRKLRQSRGSLPQDYDEQRPAKRSYSAADLAVPKETPSCDCGPDLNPR